MKVRETEIEGLKLIEPQVFGDARGWFVEQYNAERYKAASEVMQRWSRSMEGIMEMERDASGEVARYECIFELI